MLHWHIKKSLQRQQHHEKYQAKILRHSGLLHLQVTVRKRFLNTAQQPPNFPVFIMFNSQIFLVIKMLNCVVNLPERRVTNFRIVFAQQEIARSPELAALQRTF